MQVLLQGAVGVAVIGRGSGGEVSQGGSPESFQLGGEERALPQASPSLLSPKALYLQIELFHTAFK